MFIALRWMQRPASVMVWLAGNIQACLRDLQTGTSSMAHMRHLASTARGFYCFCLIQPQSSVLSVQSVQSVVEKLLKYSRLSCYYQTPQLRQISLLSQEFWIVPQKRIGKSLLNEEKGIPLQPQTRKLHSETLTY